MSRLLQGVCVGAVATLAIILGGCTFAGQSDPDSIAPKRTEPMSLNRASLDIGVGCSLVDVKLSLRGTRPTPATSIGIRIDRERTPSVTAPVPSLSAGQVAEVIVPVPTSGARNLTFVPASSGDEQLVQSIELLTAATNCNAGTR